MTRLGPDDVALANAAVAELEPRWDNTTGAPDLAPLAGALDRAAAAGAGLVIRVTLGTLGAADEHDGPRGDSAELPLMVLSD
jgi:hypothetical protein